MVDLGAILLAAISLPVKPFMCKSLTTAHVSLQVTIVGRGRTMIPSTTLLLKLPVCYLNSISMTEWHADMMSAGPFVAGMKCSGNVFGGFSSFAWQRGTLQFIIPHNDKAKTVFRRFRNFIKNKKQKYSIYISIQTVYWLLCWSTFGSVETYWVWCYKLGTPVFGEFSHFSL